jgi:hypothetical protein
MVAFVAAVAAGCSSAPPPSNEPVTSTEQAVAANCGECHVFNMSQLPGIKTQGPLVQGIGRALLASAACDLARQNLEQNCASAGNYPGAPCFDEGTCIPNCFPIKLTNMFCSASMTGHATTCDANQCLAPQGSKACGTPCTQSLECSSGSCTQAPGTPNPAQKTCSACCGDGRCDPNETCDSCSQDCGSCTSGGPVCESFPPECGPYTDSCGNPLDAGACAAEFSCQSGTCVQCTSNPPECGPYTDSCGNSIDAGSCPSGSICQGGTCVVCTSNPPQCGPYTDSCGNPLDAGPCPSGYDCQGGTCVQVCTAIVPQCGPYTDSCGNVKDAGPCPAGYTCSGGSCQPDCVSTGCGGQCGVITDNCGNSIDCGACPYCGDGICNNGETCDTCPGDCGACPPPGCGTGCGTGCGSGCGSCNPEPCEFAPAAGNRKGPGRLPILKH